MEEIIIAESMAINITDWYVVVTFLGVGIVLGMYISSQIKCHISRRINNKELLKNINNEQKKRKN